MLKYLTIACLAALATGFAPAPIVQQQRNAILTSEPAPRVVSPTSLAAVSSGEATTTRTGKLYDSKEAPKVLGGVKIGLRKLVVVTGASSGLGLSAAESLAKKGNYFVVMACRDVEKGKRGEFAWRVVDRRQRYDAFDKYSLTACVVMVSFCRVVSLQLPRRGDFQKDRTLS